MSFTKKSRGERFARRMCCLCRGRPGRQASRFSVPIGAPRGQFSQGFGVQHRHLQKGLRRARGGAATLFPVLQSAYAHAQQLSEIRLRQAYAAARFTDMRRMPSCAARCRGGILHSSSKIGWRLCMEVPEKGRAMMTARANRELYGIAVGQWEAVIQSRAGPVSQPGSTFPPARRW